VRACLVALCLLGVGCGPILLDAGTPTPRLSLAPMSASLALELLPNVPDEVDSPWGQNQLRAIEVHQFRTTLRTGFARGLQPLFRPPAGESADWVLQIGEATPEFVAAQVTPMFGVTAVTAQVRYQARLIDRTGRELRRTSGTAVGPRPAGNVDGMGDALDSAVEQLYEQIGRELLAPR
jgi:hypothetical protein